MEIRPSGLVIPSSRGDVRPPVYRCMVCKTAAFPRGEESAYEQHVIGCADRHEEELRAESPRVKLPGVYGDVGWDTEYEQWVRDNKKALIAGTKKM